MTPMRSNLLLAAAVTLATLAACRDSTDPRPTASVEWVDRGNLFVFVSTENGELDPDGYAVTLDGVETRAIGTTDTTTFVDVPQGDHSVFLSGVSANCTVNGANPLTVNVPAEGTGDATFNVTCAGGTGDRGTLVVEANTTGSDLDPDGYLVSVDGVALGTVATNGTSTFGDIPAGDHTVELSGVAENCTVDGGTFRTVTVPGGGTGTTSFAVSCMGPVTVAGIRGLGQIGSGSPTPGTPVQTFDFDVRTDLTGRFTYTDFGLVNPDGSAASVRVDPADPETAITAFTQGSTACSDPSRGAEFDAVARYNTTGGLLAFHVVACDNGPAGSGLDFFSIFVPADGYTRSGTLTSGDIVE